MRKTKVELIKIPSYKEAFDILDSLHTGEYCMRQYIKEYIGEKEAEHPDYSKLLYYRQVIIGVAGKINKSKLDMSAIDKKIQEKPKNAQLNLFR